MVVGQLFSSIWHPNREAAPAPTSARAALQTAPGSSRFAGHPQSQSSGHNQGLHQQGHTPSTSNLLFNPAPSHVGEVPPSQLRSATHSPPPDYAQRAVLQQQQQQQQQQQAPRRHAGPKKRLCSTLRDRIFRDWVRIADGLPTPRAVRPEPRLHPEYPATHLEPAKSAVNSAPKPARPVSCSPSPSHGLTIFPRDAAAPLLLRVWGLSGKNGLPIFFFPTAG